MPPERSYTSWVQSILILYLNTWVKVSYLDVLDLPDLPEDDQETYSHLYSVSIPNIDWVIGVWSQCEKKCDEIEEERWNMEWLQSKAWIMVTNGHKLLILWHHL